MYRNFPTIAEPVSDHPKCKELVVADEGRTARRRSFARRSADTSTF